jgi:HEPN domain-containing protein
MIKIDYPRPGRDRAMKQIIPVYCKHSLETLEYARLDFNKGDYTSAFLRASWTIKLLGDALLIAKGYYAPSSRNIMKVLHLETIQKRHDQYLANPDEDEIGREDAEFALQEANRLLKQAQDIDRG